MIVYATRAFNSRFKLMLFDPGKGISFEDKNHPSRRINFRIMGFGIDNAYSSNVTTELKAEGK